MNPPRNSILLKLLIGDLFSDGDIYTSEEIDRICEVLYKSFIAKKLIAAAPIADIGNTTEL